MHFLTYIYKILNITIYLLYIYLLYTLPTILTIIYRINKIKLLSTLQTRIMLRSILEAFFFDIIFNYIWFSFSPIIASNIFNCLLTC